MTATYADLELDLSPLSTPDLTPEMTLAERFDAFHKANPWVADALEALAVDWLAHGGRRIGVKALAETLRWHHQRSTRDETSTFKINNSYVSYYSRLLIARRPVLAEYIETRVQKAAPARSYCPRCEGNDWGADCLCTP